jgi:flagellar hook-associated protein 3 FlgL
VTNRITQQTITSSVLNNLQGNLGRMQKLQEQLSSGKAIQRPSDSPTGSVSALRLRSDIRRSEQLARNADDGLGWLATADSSLTQSLDVVRRVRELVLRGANGSASSQDRAAIAAEVGQLRDQALHLANSEYLGVPVFGGTASGSRAYDAAGAYMGDSGRVVRAVAPGVDVEVSLAGPVVFGPTGGDDLFKVIGDIEDHLRTDPAQLAATDLAALDAAFIRIQDALAVVGARYHQVEAMRDHNDATKLDRTNALAQVESIDLPATIVQLQLQEVAYQAALGAAARVLQPSLADFLR